MTRWTPLFIGLVGFKVCWMATVTTASTAWWWCGPAAVALWLLACLSKSPHPLREGMLIFIGALVGVSWDCSAVALGLLRPANEGAPMWRFVASFFALWLNFGATLRICFRWCWSRLPAAALLGAVAGPVSYLVGESLGAVALGTPRAAALLAIAAQYGVLFPAWLFAARLTLGEKQAG